MTHTRRLPPAPRPGSVALLGIASDENSSFLRGAAAAPPLIREALRSDSANPYTESGVDVSDPAVLADAGDLEPPAGEAAVDAITQEVAALLDLGYAPLALGGDHFVTFPVLRALRRRYDRLAILHFDAHPDLYDDFGGNRLSHASPFARIMEAGLADRLLQVGVRTLTPHQREQVARFGVEIVEMRDFDERRDLAFDEPVYVSFDLDALDPAFAPGVSHHEPGGLTTRQAISVIQRLRGRIVGGDVVELNPSRDLHGVTAMTAAKLVKEITARIVEGARG